MFTQYMMKMTQFFQMLSTLRYLGLVLEHPLVLNESVKTEPLHRVG